MPSHPSLRPSSSRPLSSSSSSSTLSSPCGPRASAAAFASSYLLTRRRFLAGASVLGAAVAVGACSTEGPSHRPAAGADPASSGAGGEGATLVIVTLAGGNDALNTVVPVGDPRYHDLRGALALDPGAAHDLGDGLALHPSLTRSKSLWDDGRLAIVHGVGFDGLDRSHFHCMDVWQAASTEDLSTGWVGRWLDLGGSDPLDAIAVGRMLPLLARGRRRSAASVPLGPFEPPGAPGLEELLVGMADRDERPPLGTLVAASSADLYAVADAVGPVVAGTAEVEATAGDGLAASLGTVAALIDAGLPTRTYAVELGGFDTHANQAPVHEALLAELDGALGELCDHVAGRDVTVVVYSEFGRRVAPNGSAGTDHGAGGTVLLAGNVQGGHHGEPADLGRLMDGDLRTTVDFRAVYGGLLEGVLAVPAADVLGQDAPAPLDLVS